ncbi:MAG: hypothetical protein IJX62_05855 [Clostridia bacterium]|nr:hypothetical protein [Clostridia bacterium]
MKKIAFRLMTAVLTLVIALGSMTSCSLIFKMDQILLGPALELYYTSLANASEAESYTMDSTLQTEISISGSTLSLALSQNSVYFDVDEEFAFQVRTSTEVRADGQHQSLTESTYGYQNGHMYSDFHDKLERHRIKLYSELSAEDYITHREWLVEISGETGYELAGAKEYSYEELEDGSHKATFSNFRPELIRHFLDQTGSVDDLFYGLYEVEALTVTFLATADKLPQELTYTFTTKKTVENTDPGAVPPTVTFTTVYRDFNNTQAPKAIDFEYPHSTPYVKVDDLRILDQVSYALDQRKNANSGAYKLDIEYLITYNGKTQTGTETDHGSFNTNENGFSFTIDATTKENTVKVTYADELKTTVITPAAGGDPTTQTLAGTDETAREFIAAQLDPGSFDDYLVSYIEIVDAEKGIYKMTVKNADASNFANLIGDHRIKCSVATYTFTMKNGKLLEYSYEISVQCQYGSSVTKNINYMVDCTYIDEPAEESES